MSAVEKRDPTYMLTVSVPLDIEDGEAETRDVQGGLAAALHVILPLINLGTSGLLCGEITVTLDKT